MSSGDFTSKVRGVVRRADATREPSGGDAEFSPDYAVTSTIDGGGRLLTHVEVILCFWGHFWSGNPSPSSNNYRNAIQALLTGSYMAGLAQYRGIGPGTLIYSEINDTSDPVNGFTDTAVVNMLKARIQSAGMPPPMTSHDRLYVVVLPVGIASSLTQYGGQHQSFVQNGVTAYYAWVENNGSLTGQNCVTKIFSHELVEACTNPNVDTTNDGILVNGAGVTGDEIGDACNHQVATVDVNGVQCTVQAYWSKADNVCLLPLSTGDNYSGLWWADPPGSESGWGINFAHQGDVLFATWFTYDATGKAWWLSMTANKAGPGVYSGTLYKAIGEPFFGTFWTPGTATAVGMGTLTFSSPTTGTFAYQVNDGANVATQTKAITMQVFGPLPTCVWARQPDLATATNYQDLWWADPPGSESGWGMNLTQQGTTIFATWFTYDAHFQPLWLSATATETAPRTYSGPLYLTSGPPFGAPVFDKSKVGLKAVGTTTLTFSDGNHGTFAFSVDLGDGLNKGNLTKSITRQIFRTPGTVCQ